jgi:hypothetical protein
MVNRDDHKARDAGCSWVYDAKECNAVRPEASPEGPPEAGSGSGGDATTAAINQRCGHPAAGSHLPLEETAPPSAVVPFASSPFAHPIPQSIAAPKDYSQVP